MAHGSLLRDVDAAAVGASDVLVFRRAAGGHFVLTSAAPTGVAEDLLLDDEPLVQRALGGHVVRIAAEDQQRVCAGYHAAAAAVIAVDCDVVVVLGRREGCLAGVSDSVLVQAALRASLAQAR